MAAACLQMIRVSRGLLRGLHLKRGSYPPAVELASLFDALVKRTHIRRPVTLRLSDELESPALLGFRKPRILLPSALLAHLETAEIEQILLHELAHVERWDDCMIVLQRIIEAIGIFHPLIGYLAHRLNLDREMACDDRVAGFYEPRQYAACLTRVAEIRQFGSAFPLTLPLLLERKSELITRVENLLDATRAHRPVASAARLLLVLGCATAAAFAAAFTPRILSSPALPAASIQLPAHPAPDAPTEAAQAPAPPEPRANPSLPCT
jgi:beta-lactamase regulating signal transducer with metallopeptidase domain